MTEHEIGGPSDEERAVSPPPSSPILSASPLLQYSSPPGPHRYQAPSYARSCARTALAPVYPHAYQATCCTPLLSHLLKLIELQSPPQDLPCGRENNGGGVVGECMRRGGRREVADSCAPTRHTQLQCPPTLTQERSPLACLRGEGREEHGLMRAMHHHAPERSHTLD